MRQPQSKIPYLILATCLALFGFYLGANILAAPVTSPIEDPLGVGRVLWGIRHLGRIPLWELKVGWLSLILAIFGFVLPFIAFYRVEPSYKYRTGEEHGSAQFATKETLMKFRDKDPKNDMLFTQNARMGLFNKRLPYAVQVNKNTATAGLPGDWKTRSVVTPNLLQANCSFVITDPKGLLVYEVGDFLRKQGYQVKVLDLITLTNSSRFNVFDYMTDETDIDRVAESIINGTKRSDNKGEDFWAQAEAFLIRSLIGYLYFDGKVLKNGEPHLGLVADLLRHLKREDPEKPSLVEKLFDALEKELPNNYACKQFRLFMKNFGGQTLTSVLAITASRFSVFDHEAVRDLTQKDTMAIETWLTQKTALFIAIPETDKTYNFLANLLFVTMLRLLPKTADEILQGRHPVYKPKDLLHLRLFMDEFAQIGKIPYFTESQSSVRSRGISIDIFIQALNQLKTVYGEEWKTIFNNCGTLLYLGTNDEDTMKYFSMRSGKETIQVRNTSRTYSQHGSSSDSIQTISRDLMTPDEIARIGIDEALVFISKQNVFKDKKYRLEEHPNYEALVKDPEDPKWYDYDMSMDDIPEWMTNYDDDRDDRLLVTAKEVEAQPFGQPLKAS